MHILWLLLVLMASGMAELLIGNHGISVPLLAMAGLYFAVLYPWPLLLPYFCLGGLWLDLCSPAGPPAHVITLLLLIPVGHNWRYFGDFSTHVGQIPPGAATGAIVGILSILRIFAVGHGGLSWLQILRIPLMQIGFGALLFPLCSMIWDGIAFHIGVRRFATVTPYDSRWNDNEMDVSDDN